MREISEAAYYDKLEKFRDQYFQKDSGEWRQHTLAIKNGREKRLAEERQANEKAFEDSYQHSLDWIADRESKDDWDKFGDDPLSANSRVTEALQKALAANQIQADKFSGYIKKQEQERTAIIKELALEKLEGFDEYISDREFYGDWEQRNDSMLAALTRQEEALEKIRNEGIISYKEYTDKLNEIDRERFTEMQKISETSVSTMLQAERTRMDETIKELRSQAADLRESWATQDRKEDLAELYRQERAVTIEGANQYKSITDNIKRLEREQQIFELEKKNNEIIEQLEADYRRMEERKEQTLQSLLDAERINGENISVKFDQAIAAVRNLTADMTASVQQMFSSSTVNHYYNNSGGNTVNATQNYNVADNVDMNIARIALNGIIRGR